MRLKTSSVPNASVPVSDTDLFIAPANLRCFISPQSNFYYIGFYISSIFLLIPLCVIVLYHGVQQWWLKRSTGSPATMSHSDIFGFHVVLMELFSASGCILSCCGIYTNDFATLFFGSLLWYFSWYGESMFHILTCLEHYLAVVHPITYMKLRNERGVRIRNASIGCAWFLSSLGMLSIMIERFFIILNFSVLFFTLLVVSFCSLTVLCVLINPGPGDQGGGRERVDQSKRRAFNTIMAILGALMLRFLGGLVWMIVQATQINSQCLIYVSIIWVTLPSSLVLPLLFLHRAGKLMCCKNI